MVPTSGAGPAALARLKASLEFVPVKLGAALFAFLIIVKVYAVSRYSLTTTLALISSSPKDVLLGTVATFAYASLGLGAILPLLVFIRSGPSALGPWLSGVLAGSFVLISLMTPVSYWLAGMGALCVFELSLLVKPETRRAVIYFHLLPPSVRSAIMARRCRLVVDALILLVVAVLPIAFLLPRLAEPWLPAQVFSMKVPVITSQHRNSVDRDPVRERVFTGYLVASSGGWDEILTEDSRIVIQVRDDQVENRYTCRVFNSMLRGQRPIYYAFLGKFYNSANTDCATVMDRVAKGALGDR